MGNLLENIYLMCSIFRYYNIIPIFIFDGKPSSIKNETTRKRKQEKQKAEKEFISLKKQFNKAKQNDKKNMEIQMDILRKKFISKALAALPPAFLAKLHAFKGIDKHSWLEKKNLPPP